MWYFTTLTEQCFNDTKILVSTVKPETLGLLNFDEI